MTERLYYTDAYLTSFQANVVATSDDGLRVYLDATAFYPTSGGQPHDIGEIDGVRVVDVVDDDDRIGHVLAAPLAARAEPRTARIDWTRRFDFMQQHTGQHLLSAVFEDLFGFKTLSVHFGADYSTVDVDADAVSRDQIVKAERRANEIVLENRPVAISFEDAASAVGLRKPSDRTGTIRIASIDGVDRSACGGTHVRATGEIGPILLRATEKTKKATRVEFLCGTRALRRARRDFEALSGIAGSLSVSLDEAAATVAAQADRIKELDGTRRRLEKELAVFRAHTLYDAAPIGANGVRTVVIRSGPATTDELRTLALAVIAHSKSVVIATLADPASALLATSEDSGIEAGRVLKEALAAVGGRGGGSPRLAQGSVPDAAALETVVGELISRVG